MNKKSISIGIDIIFYVNIILNNSVDWKYVLIGFAIIMVAVIAIYKRYNDKEFI